MNWKRGRSKEIRKDSTGLGSSMLPGITKFKMLCGHFRS